MRDGERLNPFHTTSKGIMERINKKIIFRKFRRLIYEWQCTDAHSRSWTIVYLAISHIICAYKNILYDPFAMVISISIGWLLKNVCRNNSIVTTCVQYKQDLICIKHMKEDHPNYQELPLSQDDWLSQYVIFISDKQPFPFIS